MRKNIEVLMIDRRFIEKQMKDLPGVPGAVGKEEEHLPGLPGVVEEDAEEEEEEEAEYCSKCGAKLPHDDDDDDEDDNDKQEKHIPKMEKQSLLKKLVSFVTNNYNMLSSPLYSETNDISVITIDGELGKRISESDKMSGKVDVDDITKALKIAQQAETNAVILHINSPGGVTTGIQECGDVIKKLGQTKPVFAFTDTVAASAAYWLASCTNGIFVTPSSEIGSIGVIAKVVDYSESLKMSGVNVQVFSAGELKTLGHGDVGPLSDEEKQFIQNDINEQYQRFTALVNENRGGVAEENMQGQLFTAEKAVKANLADEIVADLDILISKIASE